MKYFIDTEFLEGTQKEKFPISLFRKETKPTIDLISIGIVSEDFEKTLMKPYDVYIETVKTHREYYAISKDFNLKEAWNRFQIEEGYNSGDIRNTIGDKWQKKVYWIRENVLKPIFNDLLKKHSKGMHYLSTVDVKFCYKNLKWLINKYGKTNKQIAEEIKEFCYDYTPKSFDESIKIKYQEKRDIQFYAYYADYDWVAFCWLFGKMIDLPKGFPMFAFDLKQIFDEKIENKRLEVPDGLGNMVKIPNTENKLDIVKRLSNYPKRENEHNALADAKWNKELHEFLINL
jgi:hypothetical protein